MALNNNTYTAPLALIMYNNVVIGKMKGVRVNEQIQRGNVQGLGQLIPDEKPALSWSGTVQCDFYNINFTASNGQGNIPNALIRQIPGGNYQAWTDSVTLQEIGVDLVMFKRQSSNLNSSQNYGLIPGYNEPYASIRSMFLDSEGFDINEGSISGKNQSFTYLYPIILAI